MINSVIVGVVVGGEAGVLEEVPGVDQQTWSKTSLWITRSVSPNNCMLGGIACLTIDTISQIDYGG